MGGKGRERGRGRKGRKRREEEVGRGRWRHSFFGGEWTPLVCGNYANAIGETRGLPTQEIFVLPNKELRKM